MNTPDAPKSGPSRPQENLSPRQRGDFFRALADFQTELFRAEAGFLPAVKEWRLKHDLAASIFRDARKVQDIRIRCRELGANFHGQHISKAIRGASVIQHLCHAPSGEVAIRAVFSIIKPAACELLQTSKHRELLVFDAPSIALIDDLVSELERQIRWAEPLVNGEIDESESWWREMKALTEHLPEALASARSVLHDPVLVGRRCGMLPVLHSAIPEGFRELESGTPPPDTVSYRDSSMYHAHNFLMELQAAESCASLLFEAPDMPWEFYFDVARHMWDEMRHCQFGELKLAALGVDIADAGISNTAYVMRQTLDPIDRYTALTTQEADAFPGKHLGLKTAIENGDDILARAWSYDIADETQHVRYGHKWIPVMIEITGECRSYDQLKRDAENWRRDVLGAAYSPTARSFAG